MDEFVWRLTAFYAAVNRSINRFTGHHVKGVGFLLRRLKSDRIFHSCGHTWYLDHRLGGTYARLLSGAFNEPETNAFLQFIADKSTSALTFIDVGANIGEMAVPMATNPAIAEVIAFEPHPVCAAVLRRTFELNDVRNARVHESVVGDGTAQPYYVDADTAPVSGIRNDIAGVPLATTVRIDDVVPRRPNTVFLIDVEGAELDVMTGARDYIEKCRPLLIFEYHEGTRKSFSLEAVRDLLGADYDLLRLRSDGYLDRSLEDTWNVVAVHTATEFAGPCASRLRSSVQTI